MYTYTYKTHEEWFVVFFIIKTKSESKRLLGTNFVAEDTKENIQTISVYIAANFSNRIK